MTRVPLVVQFNGAVVGRLTYRGPADYVLKYDDSWLDRDDAVPVSLSMPLAPESHSGTVVERFLDNLLPDGETVRDRWAVDAGLDRADPFDLIAAYGADVAGALSFLPEGGDELGAGALIPINASEIADWIARIRRDDATWNDRRSTAGRFSLGGAQGKFALAREDDQWFQPSGTRATTHIFKPHVRGIEDGDLIEFVVMTAALACGLEVAPVALEQFDEEHSLVVRRFDRIRSDGEVLRIHQEDLCQALGISRLRKYEVDDGPGVDHIVQLIQRTAEQTVRADSVLRYLRHLMYSWIVLDTDAHAKNFSVQLTPGGAILAPAYDMSSLVPYHRLNDDDDRVLEAYQATELSARVGATFRAGDVSWIDWVAVARRSESDPSDLVEWGRNACDTLEAFVPALVASEPLLSSSPLALRLATRIAGRCTQARQSLREPRI